MNLYSKIFNIKKIKAIVHPPQDSHPEYVVSNWDSPEYECGYDPKRKAQVIDFKFHDGQEAGYSELVTKHGGTRSNYHMFVRRCPNCTRCKSLRICVNEFQYNRTQKKMLRRGHEKLKSKIVKNTSRTDEFELAQIFFYSKFNNFNTRSDLEKFLNFKVSEDATKTIRFMDRRTNELKMVSHIDFVENGIVAYSTQYDLDKCNLSYGVYNILFLIEMAKSLNLEHVYLGYAPEGVSAFAYKLDYAHEVFQDKEWVRIKGTK